MTRRELSQWWTNLTKSPFHAICGPKGFTSTAVCLECNYAISVHEALKTSRCPACGLEVSPSGG